MKYFIVLFLSLSLGLSALPVSAASGTGGAAPDTEAAQPGADQESGTVHIHVLGMVCEFCAHSIMEVFKDQGAETLKIDLDTGIVTVEMKPGHRLSDEEIHKLIEYGGYDLEKIERAETPPDS